MTRINVGIEQINTTDQHLIASLREIPRVFTAVKKRIEQNQSFYDIPDTFKLGTGHVKFFYNKLRYIEKLFLGYKYEYLQRFGKEWPYSIEYDAKELDAFIKLGLYNDYWATEEDQQLLIDRISERITDSNQKPRYYGQTISKEQAIENLKR